MSTWQLDPFHTQIEFSAKHLGMMTVRGTFTDVTPSGTVDLDDPENSHVEITIRADSIKTHHEQRDNHLRSSDFLEIEKYPTARFITTSVARAAGDAVTVTGDLTVKDVTRSVTFDLTRMGEFNDPAMGHRIAYSGQLKLSRKDFGVKFNAALDGKFIVSDEVTISLEGELIEQSQAEQSPAN